VLQPEGEYIAYLAMPPRPKRLVTGRPMFGSGPLLRRAQGKSWPQWFRSDLQRQCSSQGRGHLGITPLDSVRDATLGVDDEQRRHGRNVEGPEQLAGLIECDGKWNVVLGAVGAHIVLGRPDAPCDAKPAGIVLLTQLRDFFADLAALCSDLGPAGFQIGLAPRPWVVSPPGPAS